MSGCIQVFGHAWQREFCCHGGERHCLPGGAAQIGGMLRHKGLEVSFSLPSSMQTQPVSLDDTAGGLLLAHGEIPAPTGGCTPPQEDNLAASVVWDEGWGGIIPPKTGPVLWASEQALPSPSAMAEIGDRCFLLLSIDALRLSGAGFSRGRSWERTVTELMEILQTPGYVHLLTANVLLISFGAEGAALFTNQGEDRAVTLHLLSGDREGWFAEQSPGFALPDVFAMQVYQTALQFRAVLAGEQPTNVAAILSPAGELWQTGYLPELFAAGLAIPVESGKAGESVKSFPFPQNPAPDWNILGGWQDGALYDLAFALAAEGFGKLAGYPRLQTGGWVFYHRAEIDALTAPESRQLLQGLDGAAFLRNAETLPGYPGLNRLNETDDKFILRRAVLLRQLLDMKYGRGTVPPQGLLHALLLAPAYKQGAASLEFLLDELDWEEAETLPLTGIPSFYGALVPHVEPEAFLRLLRRETFLIAKEEELARAIHERYRGLALENPRTEDPATGPWEELPPYLKLSNLRQAASIRRKLRIIGCGYDGGDAPYPTVNAFTPQEVEQLARMEHDFWVAERLALGWRHGKHKDSKRKTSPYVAPWAELDDSVRQLDRDLAAHIVSLLEGIGLRVYRKI